MKLTDLTSNASIQGILGKLRQGDKKIIAALLALLVLAAYLDFAFILKNQVRSVQGLGPKIAKLNKDLDSLKRDLAKMKEIQAREPEPEAQDTATEGKRLLTQDEIPYILEVISGAAAKNSVKILQMKPLQEKRAPADKLTPLLISADLICGYHQLGKFINNLENSPFFFAVQGIKISPQAQDILNQKVSLALKTYVKK